MKLLDHADKVSIKLKLLVFALVALLAVAIPSYFLQSKATKTVSQADLSIVGVPLAQQTVLLRKFIAQHRGTSARFMGGDSTAKGMLSNLAQEVDKRFKTLSQELSAQPAGTEALSLLQKQQAVWQDIQYAAANQTKPGAKVFDEHSELIVNIGEVNAAILRSFKLFYAPSDSSYHLVIANFNALPALTDALGKIRGKGAGVLAKQSLPDDVRATLVGVVNNAKAANVDFLMNLRAASANSDESNARSLMADVDQFERAILQTIELLEQNILTADSLTYSSSDFFNNVTTQIGSLYSKQAQYVELLSTFLTQSRDKVSSERNSFIWQIALLLLIAATVFFVVNYSITRGISDVLTALHKLSQNDFSIAFTHLRGDEVGKIQKDVIILNDILKASSEQAKEAMRVKQALDNSSTCFMIANNDRNIIYMNESVQTLLKKAQSDIQKQLPNFDASDLMGKNIDSFHKNPMHQRGLLEKLKDEYITNLTLGAYNFRLIVNPIFDNNGEPLGHSVEWHDMTEIYENERRITRILESLNCTSTNIMIADSERKIIYLNRAVQQMLKDVEADLRKVLPNFSADTLIGTNMDGFHKNPAHQAKLLETFTEKFVTQIEVGNRHFRLIANPIFSEKGDRLGSVVEWLDRTKEVQAEREIANLVESAVHGDFSKRATTQEKEGFNLRLSESLNQLLDITESGLNEINTVLMAIADGDLTQRIESKFEGTFNEMKTHCNQSADTLAEVISEIRDATETITSGSSEIAKGNSDLSSRTEQQASSLEETASSMEELTSTVQLNAENAKQANGLASEASTIAADGGKQIQQVVGTMSEINDSAAKIADIIGVIDGIAFQTNILALNAAVEAARAGEQGRGFAVVASEVRTLAQRSANAAKDIKELISDSVSKVESGNELVKLSGETMSNVVNAIKRVNDIMAEIASASAEQASGIDEVNRAIVHMDEMTQQNAALVEEAAAAAESMNTQAAQLSQRVQTFTVDENQAKPSTNAVLEHKPKQTVDVSPAPIPSASDDEDEWESF